MTSAADAGRVAAVRTIVFCGGRPLRPSETERPIPKPMIMIGYRPVLWHVMRTYAHWGMNDFVLCLGYGGDQVKNYFLTYEETLSNDFVISGPNRDVEVLGSDIHDWRIAFVDTGIASTLAQRLLATRRIVGDDEIFCANYGDVVTDAPLADLVTDFRGRTDKVAALLSVRPRFPTQIVEYDASGTITSLREVTASNVRVNGGFYIFRSTIFEHLRPGEDLIRDTFPRLLADGLMHAYEHDGFWSAVDTLRDVETLVELQESSRAPWALWEQDPQGRS
jgi:glucose-1-phosphate cytidylyltransferase